MIEENDLRTRRLQYFQSAVKAIKLEHAPTKDGLFPWKSGIQRKDTFVAGETNLKCGWFEWFTNFSDNLK